MDFTGLIERFGDGGASAIIGLLIGISFGIFSQKSKFCLRAAAVEFGRGVFGTRLAVWLFVFSGAVVGTQLLITLGVLNVSGARLLNMRASLSGAIIGGVMFGCGMVLARGCAGRLLVLAGQGNLRSLLTGLVFAVTAQASLVGILSPLRERIAGLWTFEGANLDALSLLGLPPITGLLVALIWLMAAIYFGAKSGIPLWGWAGGLGVGLTVMCGWLLTYWLAQQAFDPQPVKSMTFTGPSARSLMLFLSPPGQPFDFDTGLVPGVLVGSFLAAFAGRELKLEGFQGGQSMRRYMLGAVLMGFGGMLAGGCSVASVSGSAVFSTTAWVTLFAIWAGATAMDWAVDYQAQASVGDVAADASKAAV